MRNRIIPDSKPVEEVKKVQEEPKAKEVKVEEPETVDAEVYGVDSMLNIRSTPEVKDDNVITLVKKGTKLKVVDPKKAEKDSWYKIIVTDMKMEGYAMKKYIKII
jgi:hypothetical protein